MAQRFDLLEAPTSTNAGTVATLPREVLEEYFRSNGLDCQDNKDVLAQQRVQRNRCPIVKGQTRKKKKKQSRKTTKGALGSQFDWEFGRRR